MSENVTHIITFGYDDVPIAERERIDTEIRCDRVRWKVQERRMWLAAGIVFIIACLLSLTGCGGLPRTVTTVPDRVNGSLPPPASQPATSEDWTALTIKLDEARAEVNRKAAELEAKARNERTWMFTMIGSGILLLLGGGAIAVVGFKTPTQHTTKAGVFVAIVGIGFILIAPHGAEIAKPVLFGAYSLFGTLALGAMFWMANNLYYDWLERSKA